MNAKEFGTWVQGYYGLWNATQKLDIWEYIRDFSPAYLDALKSAVLHGYSSQYGRPPDVAVFEQLRSDAASRMERPLMIASVPVDGELLVDFTVEKAMQEIRRRARAQEVKE